MNHLSEEHKRKISETKKGKIPYVMTNEIRKNISIGHKGLLMGNKCPSWKGGVSLDKKTYRRNWRLANLVKVRFWDLRNKHNRRTSEGSYTEEEWESLKKKCNYFCMCCKRKEPIIKLTMDHIIPIRLGGTNYINNIQPLCKSCNSHKMTDIKNFL
jgi:hypothetical protein